MVFIQVSAVLAFTFVPHTRSGNLTQAINIVLLDSQLFFYLMTHIFRPGSAPKAPTFSWNSSRGKPESLIASAR